MAGCNTNHELASSQSYVESVSLTDGWRGGGILWVRGRGSCFYSKQEAEEGLGYASFLVVLGALCCPGTFPVCVLSRLPGKVAHLWAPSAQENMGVYAYLQGLTGGGCGLGQLVPLHPTPPNQLNEELKGKSRLTGLSS